VNGVQAKKVLSYVMLPEVIPRAKVLFASGFGYIAFLMANIYGAVRLLPRGHAYLNPANIGHFGVLHVIGEAANNLVISKKNIDQLAIFVAMLLGVVIIIAQIALVLIAILFPEAHAVVPNMAASIFLTPNPSGATVTDMAFVVLDQVFGVPQLFCTEGKMCTPVMPGNVRWPFHIAFHELLRFYSMGLLLIGVIIFLYYVVVVVGETATTGHPFGQRFQNAWAPIRLVVALGLLVPIQYGMNSSQYIVLYAAKYGSGFATNGWLQFNTTLRGNAQFPAGVGANPTGERSSLLSRPKTPDMAGLAQTMSLVHACAYAYWKTDPAAQGTPSPPSNNFYIKAYLVKNPQTWMTNTAEFLAWDPMIDYPAALAFYNNSDIIIRFGRHDPANPVAEREKGGVTPLCGDIRIPVNYLKTRGQGITGAPALGGPDAMQEHYYNMVRFLWFNTNPPLVKALSQRYMEMALNRKPDDRCSIGCGWGAVNALPSCTTPATPECQTAQTIGGRGRQLLIEEIQTLIDGQITTSWNNYNANATDVQMQNPVLDRGWAGAGIWYNTIAEINGAFVGAVLGVPTFVRYPDVMERVREERRKNDSDVSPKMQFNTNLKDGRPAEIGGPMNNLEIAQKLNDYYLWWNRDDPSATVADKTVTGGAFHDAINAIFGMGGLFSMRQENAHIHPLAQLAAVGKSLVDSAIINIGTSTVTAGLGGILRIADPHGSAGALAEVASNITMTIAFLGLTAGFILYYVLPFLPFLYFFFAFGTWVKSIFEAMVGAPLWALAHMRLDGEGLPGDSASSGYFLIFEIFVRPILTVFGLIASILILTAQVRMLNFLWTLVTTNLTGSHLQTGFTGFTVFMLPRNTIDQFFFTIVYAVIVYMMATASFKLIDKIPDQLLRFMGVGVSAFSDINPDPTEGLTRYAALGGITVGREMTQGIRGLAKGVGGTVGDELQGVANAFKK